MIYLVDSKNTDTTTELYVFKRDKNGVASTEIISTFKPYLFTDEEAPVDKFDGVVKVEYGFTSIDNTKVKKVFMQKSMMVKNMRKAIETMEYKHWEADVLFHNRYTIDLEGDMEKGPLKICWFDIETAPEDTFKAGKDLSVMVFPDIQAADQAICCLSIKIDGKKDTWLCGPNEVPGTHYFPKEEDMLEDFLNYFHKASPDIISAWNLNNFDIIYFIHRCERLDVNHKRLSKIFEVWNREFKGKTYFRIFGTVQFDLLDAYKLWRKYGNLPLLGSYSLDFVAKTVLNDSKIQLDKSIGWLWKNNPEKLVEYNQHDVELLDMIDKKCKVVDFFDEVRRKCHIQFEDVYKTTAIIDGLFLNRLKGKIILPTGKFNDADKYGGAEVFDPIPGLYYNILCEDIASMYPSIIKNFNISYETVGGGEIILPLEHPISFSTKPGIIPMFFDELKVERNHYKDLMKQAQEDGNKDLEELYDQRQFGVKIIMNSIYGYLGFTSSRLYKKEVANAITSMGKYIIKKIKKWTEERGNKVIYGDTDSIYVTSEKKDKYSVVTEGVEIANYINKKLEELALSITDNNCLKIEFEKALSIVLFTDAKKRYAYKLLWENNKKFEVDTDLHIQGFDSKRSDSNIVSKLTQNKVIEMIMDEKSKDDVIAYVREMNKRMLNRTFTDYEIGVPKGITKKLCQYDTPGPMIKGALYSNLKFGTEFGKGSKPKFIYIKNYKGMNDKVTSNGKEYYVESIAFNDNIPEGFEIDWDKMTQNTFEKKLTKIFEARGWKWENINVRGLFSF